ncbi:unnamed protein product [Spodoptera littoralis]|uniref:C2H2-type domain-containing protein n=1 Tax=Spodoptera littoralis TaxID=7109 RepID=A0A9P0I9R6_SPOLI|nr:unnamed protein product [Spodoptera littoralis]CAH1642760.1 unnamed protein product [Spodoptera littoralis]
MHKEDDLLQKKERRKSKNNVSDSYDDTKSEMDKEDDLLQKKERRKRKNNVSESYDTTISEMHKEDDLLQKKERRKRKNNISDSYDNTKSEMDKEDDLLQKKERRKRKNNVSDSCDDTMSEMNKEDDLLQKKEKKKNISVSDGGGTESEFEKEDEQKEIKRKKQQNTSRRQYATSRVIHKTFMGKLEQFYDNVNIDFPDIENIKSLEKPKYKCKTCQVAYRRYLDYVRHNVFKHTELKYPTPCNICKDDITSTAHLHAHWKLRHNVMMKCKFCGDICRSMGELKKHLNRTHTKIYTCDKCAQEFPTLKEFSEHHQKVHEFFECDYCQAKYRSKTALEKHIKNTHVPYQCTVCKKTFRNFRIFVGTHVKYHHPELLDKLNIRSKIKPTSKELRYCVECDKQFASIHLYKRHIEHSVKHTRRPIEDITCPACKKVFHSKIYRNNHYELFHTNKTKYYCEICNKYFARGLGLKNHIKHVHQKIPQLKNKFCNICDRGFSTNRILVNHRRTHTGERPHKCQYCPAAFAQKTAMMTHQKTQHKNVISSSSHQT